MPWAYDPKKERAWHAMRLFAVGLLSGREDAGFRRREPRYFVMAKDGKDAVKFYLTQQSTTLVYEQGIILDPITVTEPVTQRERILGEVGAEGQRTYIYEVPAEDLGQRNFALLEDLEHGKYGVQALLFPTTLNGVEYQTYYRCVSLNSVHSHEAD
jgi:hypothetical protein